MRCRQSYPVTKMQQKKQDKMKQAPGRHSKRMLFKQRREQRETKGKAGEIQNIATLWRMFWSLPGCRIIHHVDLFLCSFSSSLVLHRVFMAACLIIHMRVQQRYERSPGEYVNYHLSIRYCFQSMTSEVAQCNLWKYFKFLFTVISRCRLGEIPEVA